MFRRCSRNTILEGGDSHSGHHHIRLPLMMVKERMGLRLCNGRSGEGRRRSRRSGGRTRRVVRTAHRRTGSRSLNLILAKRMRRRIGRIYRIWRVLLLIRQMHVVMLPRGQQGQPDGPMGAGVLVVIPQSVHVLVSPRARWNLTLIWLQSSLSLFLA